MEFKAQDAVDELLQTYSETGGINYLDVAAILPSREEVDLVCADLMSLMFPGFRGEPLVRSEDLPQTTLLRMKSVAGRLKAEICKSFGQTRSPEDAEQSAQNILNSFMSELPELRKMIWKDIDAAYEGDPSARSYEEIVLAYPSLEAIAIQRMAHLFLTRRSCRSFHG